MEGKEHNFPGLNNQYFELLKTNGQYEQKETQDG
jgi:hypothetical protein